MNWETISINDLRSRANSGDVEAIYWLAKRIFRGQGVPKDEAGSIEYFLKAARQGHRGAQKNLGISYEYGEGVGKDLGQALSCYKKAGDQGLAGANYNVGRFYQYGWSVPVSMTTALRYYNLAARQGHDKAREVLRRLGHPVPPTDLQRRQEVVSMIEQTLNLAEQANQHLASARLTLDKAEVEFSQGYFSPFWSRIEESLKQFAAFEADVSRIQANRSRFYSLKSELRLSGLAFPVVMSDQQAVRAFNARLDALTRSAHRDFQFSSIYEQRRTSSILIQGFANLGDAIDRLGDRVESSVETLYTSLSNSVADLEESVTAAGRESEARLSEIRDSFPPNAPNRPPEVDKEYEGHVTRASRIVHALPQYRHLRGVDIEALVRTSNA